LRLIKRQIDKQVNEDFITALAEILEMRYEEVKFMLAYYLVERKEEMCIGAGKIMLNEIAEPGNSSTSIAAREMIKVY
jgi:hypothetical protein